LRDTILEDEEDMGPPDPDPTFPWLRLNPEPSDENEATYRRLILGEKFLGDF